MVDYVNNVDIHYFCYYGLLRILDDGYDFGY